MRWHTKYLTKSLRLKIGDDGNDDGTVSAVIILTRLTLMLNVIAGKQNVWLTFHFLIVS